MKQAPRNLKEALERYMEKVYPSKEKLVEALESGRKLTIYHGVDPTAPQLHFGHATNYFLLCAFQRAGHKIILLVGDFTARIGDPTGKSQTRKPLTRAEIKANWKTYKQQAGKILDFSSKKNPVLLKYNSTWLAKLTLEDLVGLAASVTVSQMIQRDMFQERLKAGREIYLHEFLYPLMQGYDSVAMNVDGEVGGTDQTFNMLVGRDLLWGMKKKEKFVFTTPLLVNPKTRKKLMSKSEGGYIGLNDPPTEMYGKTMALPDEVVFPCLRLCTSVPLHDVEKLEVAVQQNKDSFRNAKAFLAKTVVELYHGAKSAQTAEEEFVRVFRHKEQPSKIPEIRFKEKKLPLPELLFKAKLVSSKSGARRLVLQGGVKIDGAVQKDWNKNISCTKGTLIQVGKRRFVRIA